MDGSNKSLEKIRLCKEKIQKENITIENNINRINTRLEEMELDNANIQKYAAEIETVMEKGKIEKDNKIKVSNKNVNKNKTDCFMLIAILYTGAAYSINTAAIYCDCLKNLGDILVYAVNTALLCNAIKRIWLKIITFLIFIFLLSGNILCQNAWMKIGSNLMSVISITHTLRELSEEH